MARIGLIRQGLYPGDPRVRREVSVLLADGHDVDVVCDRLPDEPAYERDGALTVTRLQPLHERRGASALRYLAGYGTFAATAFGITTYRHLRRPYDLVQVNTLPDPLVFAALVPRLTGTPVLLDLQECMPEFFATKFAVEQRHPVVRVIERLEQVSIRVASHAVTPTEQMLGAFVGRGARRDRITVVGNGPDAGWFDPHEYPPRPREPGRFDLICHGSVEDRYGIDTMIEAVALLGEEIPGLRLEIVGEGTFLPRARELACELRVEERVGFSGRWLSRDELLAAIASADAGIVAMKRDAFRDLTLTNKMFDYVTMQRPAIVSRTRSVEESFDESSFVLFRAGDARDLARAIRTLYADPALADRLVQHATRSCEQFDWSRQQEIYRGVVRHLLERRVSRSRRRWAVGGRAVAREESSPRPVDEPEDRVWKAVDNLRQKVQFPTPSG
jgi:glycosyltransferase involved in cell wall biosynthesis